MSRAVVPEAPAPAAEPQDKPWAGLAAETEFKANSLTKDATLFTLASYGSQALSFVAGLVNKALLGPVGAGYWALMQTFWTFMAIAPLGAANGAARQIPAHRGKGDYEAAAAVSDTGGSFALVAISLLGVFVAVTAALFGGDWAPEIQWGLVVLGLSAPLRYLSDFHEVLMQATKRFSLESLTTIVRAVTLLGAQVALVWAFGFWGMWVGLIVSEVALFALWYRKGLIAVGRPAFHFRIDRSRLRELISFGLPIAVHAQIWQLFLATGSLTVATALNVEQLGYYSLAVSVTSYILYLPRSVAAAVFPRMTEKFAKSNAIESIRSFAVDTQALLSLTLIPIFMGGFFYGLPVIIRQGLPDFVPAIEAVHVLVAGAFFIALVNMPIKVLITAGYRWKVTAVMAICLVLNIVANVVGVVILDGGLRGAAISTSVSYAITFAIMTGYALSRAVGARDAVKHIAELLAIFVWIAAALWGIEELLGAGGGDALADIGNAVAKMALFTVLMAPLFFVAERRYQAITRVRTIAGRVAARRRRGGGS